MIADVAKTALLSLGVGFLAQLSQDWLGSQYFTEFLKANLINILIALLAVNSATMGIVLTKIRDLVDNHGHGETFTKTRRHMLLSIREQVVLVGAAILILTVWQSPHLKAISNVDLFFGACIIAIFVYGMSVLYDTAMSVLIIVDFG